MTQYISKSALVVEIEKRINSTGDTNQWLCGKLEAYREIHDFIDTLEVKEVNLTDRKTDWPPSKKQMESLKDMLKYNIGVFDYQKFMEVNSLYEDLTKILDYETDRQK